MAERDDERRKGGVPLPAAAAKTSAAALASGGAGLPAGAGVLAVVFAGPSGKAALALLLAALGCGVYGASLAVASLSAPPPAPAAAPARLSAPDAKRQALITPQDSMKVLPLSQEGNAAAVAQDAGASGPAVALAPAPQGAPPPAAAAGAADPDLPNHIVAKASALKPKAEVLPAAVATDGGIGKKAGASPAKEGPAAAPSGSGSADGLLASAASDQNAARGFGRDDGRRAASSGRAAAGAGGRGGMRQLIHADKLRGGGTGEASASRGSQAFDGGGGYTQTVPGAPPAVSGGDPKKLGTAADYGEDGAPVSAGDSPPSSGVAPAPDAGHKNATPWQGLVEAATMLMLAATGFLLLEMWFAHMAKSGPPHGAAFLLAARAAAGVALGMGLAATAIGAKIMSMGQSSQGLMLVLGGAAAVIMSILALIHLFDPKVVLAAKTAAPATTANAAISQGAQGAAEGGGKGGIGHFSAK